MVLFHNLGQFGIWKNKHKIHNKMKIRMSKSYMVYELYDTIEINKEDYPDLKDLTDEDAVTYLQDNMWEFPIEEGDGETLGSEFEFNKDIIKDKFTQEEYTLHLLKED